MKKFLMIATVPSMIGQFNMNNIKVLLDMGYEVHVACNFNNQSVWTRESIDDFKEQLSKMGIRTIQIDLDRTPYNIFKIIKLSLKLHVIIKMQGYEALHCHTPVAGLVARLAALGTKTKVIYTAHGFHFHKGAPLKNWLFYYPVEKICSYMTDIIITINREDYALACKKMKAKKVVYVPGIGIDMKKFDTIRQNHIREELDIPADAKVLLSVGELNKNKNHEAIIRALLKIQIEKTKIYYVIAGQGDLKEYLQNLINELGLKKYVKLLGFRTDILELYDAADIFVFPSYREGLSVALMEAMSYGLPILCSNIRGNIDLIDSDGGCTFNPKDIGVIRKKIEYLISLSGESLKKMGKHNRIRVYSFDEDTVERAMKKIYDSILSN